MKYYYGLVYEMHIREGKVFYSLNIMLSNYNCNKLVSPILNSNHMVLLRNNNTLTLGPVSKKPNAHIYP